MRDAVARGADGLAMAGGDGSQAIVAAVAAELDLPYACIPAGTRNHFALDLGVDRDDVVGALDAFVDGGERRVDLAEVNGRVFVNNVSLGLYAEAVQREGYRDAKLRTLLDTVPDVARAGRRRPRPALDGPGGQRAPAGAAILVSNNRYRLGRAVGSGTRPRIDDGLLGDHRRRRDRRAAARGPRARSGRGASGPRRRSRSTRTAPVPAGIDGEALVLEPPLRFAIRPGVLRVRIAPAHPGASPSANAPEGPWDAAPARAYRAGPRARPTNHRGAPMDLIEITEKERLGREEAAARLHALADMLARHNDVEFERGGIRFKVHVPDEVDFKLEIEIETDERELEIELKW